MAEVHLIGRGCYSYWRIVAVFSTEEKADAYMAAEHECPSEMTHDVYTLDSELDGSGAILYGVEMDQRNGNTGVPGYGDGITVEVEPDADALRVGYRLPNPNRDTWWAYEHAQRAINMMTFYVWAKTKKQAIKAANERRVMLIAEGVLPVLVPEVAFSKRPTRSYDPEPEVCTSDCVSTTITAEEIDWKRDID